MSPFSALPRTMAFGARAGSEVHEGGPHHHIVLGSGMNARRQGGRQEQNRQQGGRGFRHFDLLSGWDSFGHSTSGARGGP